jgi:Coenzyme PQQ synthesis protein D (PqqD)
MLFEGRQISKSSSFVCSSLGDELLIYDSASGNVHVLNKTAHEVWNWLDADVPVEEMASRLSGAYAGLTRERAHRDVQQILRAFVQSGIMTTDSKVLVAAE